MRREGLIVNHKKTGRVYREEGLAIRLKTPKRRRVVIELRVAPPTPKRQNEIWPMDFVHDQLADGRKTRTLNSADKSGRECHAVVGVYKRSFPLAGVRKRVCVPRLRLQDFLIDPEIDVATSDKGLTVGLPVGPAHLFYP